MSSKANENENKIAEFEPPLACVNRIIKSVLPDNGLVTKEARQAIVRIAGIFIFYLTHCANDFTKENKRSTMQTVDVLSALKELGFEDIVEKMDEFLELHRAEVQAAESKKSSIKMSSISGFRPSDNQIGNPQQMDVDMNNTFGKGIANDDHADEDDIDDADGDDMNED